MLSDLDAAADDAPARLPRTPLDWLRVFGPGAIVASLTIGTGELIFSTRGGVIFGYDILFVFVVVSVLKWGLVLASARHIVLTGVHPYQRMISLPGPRGWMTYTLFLIAALALPIWISFHCSVLGNMVSWLTGTSGQLGGGIDYVWAAGFLVGVLALSATGGYTLLERVQVFIVFAMVCCAGVTLVLYRPDWLALLWGAVVPSSLEYPEWLAVEYPEIARHSVWVETTRYVGVIGGAGFDYMAYTSFLREKGWGRGLGPASEAELASIAAEPGHPVRQWLRAPTVDLTISFVIVVAFCAVFVASGSIILEPQQKIPDEERMLELQAEFVTSLHPWLWPLYVCGALLAMVGTLYGTMEVACSLALELAHTQDRSWALGHRDRIRRGTVAWCAVGAAAVLVWLVVYQASGTPGKPPLLLALLTPINLFTGVLSCGVFCFLVVWMDRRFLPSALRMPGWLTGLNLLSGALFVAIGLKGYWDAESRSLALGGLALLVTGGYVIASLLGPRLVPSRSP